MSINADITAVLAETGDFMQVKRLANVLSKSGTADQALYKRVQKAARRMADEGTLEANVIRKGTDRGTYYRVPAEAEPETTPEVMPESVLDSVLTENADLAQTTEVVPEPDYASNEDGSVKAAKFKPIKADPVVIGERYHVTMIPALPHYRAEYCTASTMVITDDVPAFEKEHGLKNALDILVRCPDCGGVRKPILRKSEGLLIIKPHLVTKRKPHVRDDAEFIFERRTDDKGVHTWVKVPVNQPTPEVTDAPEFIPEKEVTPEEMKEIQAMINDKPAKKASRKSRPKKTA